MLSGKPEETRSEKGAAAAASSDSSTEPGITDDDIPF